MSMTSLWDQEGVWFPMFVDRILTSQAYVKMQDYQQAWYLNLIMHSVRSSHPGYLRLDGDLWRLANARTKQFFERENAVVMACFRRREITGEVWIYNERLLRTLEDQESKFYRRAGPKKPSSSPSPSDCSEEESKATPNLPPLALAKGMIEHLRLVFTGPLQMDIEAAIRCAMSRRGCTAPDAHDYLIERAMRARKGGIKINRFWFQDADGWESNGNQQHGQISKAKQRAASNLSALGVLPQEDAFLGGPGNGEGFNARGGPALGIGSEKDSGTD